MLAHGKMKYLIKYIKHTLEIENNHTYVNESAGDAFKTKTSLKIKLMISTFNPSFSSLQKSHGVADHP